MRGYFKAAQNATEETSNSQVSGNDNKHTTTTDDLGNQRLDQPQRDIKMLARFADYEL
jgi:hypothetical protein